MLKSMDVECPACGAKVGEPCKTLTGKAMPESHSHSKRKRDALAKQYPDVDVKQGDALVVRKATEGK
jgi:ubiquitin